MMQPLCYKAYIPKDFQHRTAATLRQADKILLDYREQGYVLTLRQLYYKFVATGLIPNSQREYNRLGTIINDGRLAGLLDWNSIEDRTRNLASVPHWDSPEELVGIAAEQFRIDKWARQPIRPEVWVEKEALAGIVGQVCDRLDVAYFACRGYVSQSEMWRTANRLRHYEATGQRPIIFHLGDHDPSGMDMSRDILDRLEMFGARLDFERLALNMDQVEQYNPPPNPAKFSDSRCEEYVRLYGDESWELDALEPAVLEALIDDAVAEVREEDLWDEAVEEEKDSRHTLDEVARTWDHLIQFMEEGPG